MFPFFLKHLGFAAFFLLVYMRATVLYVLKFMVELRTFHILFCDTFSSWCLTFWILNSELVVHKIFRCWVTCLWQVLGVAREPFHMPWDDMWSGYADQFPRQLSHALWGVLGKLKKDVASERSGATMSPSHCLLSFVFFPAFPILLTGVSSLGDAFHCPHSRRCLGAHWIEKNYNVLNY